MSVDSAWRDWRFYVAAAVALALTIAGIFVCYLAISQPAASPPKVRPVPPQVAPIAQHVVIISIDGLRPDLLLRGDTPRLHALLPQSSFTFWARTTAMSITLPSHVSMMTGVTPDRHGIIWNGGFHGYPKYPTLFEVARKYRPELTTAVVAGKEKFRAFLRPGIVDFAFVPLSDDVDDPTVAAYAADLILKKRPNILFVHFANPDQYGHKYGWASPEQFYGIHQADTGVGLILDALDETHLADQTLVIISADHGGAGKSHGPDDPRSRHIPWIARGPNIRHGTDLTTDAPLTVNTEDTFATASYFLGLPIDPAIDGRPVMPILEERDLLWDIPK